MSTPLRTSPAELKRYPCVINKKLYTTIYAANLTAAKRKVRSLLQELSVSRCSGVAIELLEFVHHPEGHDTIINSYSSRPDKVLNTRKISWSKATVISDKEAVRKVISATATVTTKK